MNIWNCLEAFPLLLAKYVKLQPDLISNLLGEWCGVIYGVTKESG